MLTRFRQIAAFAFGCGTISLLASTALAQVLPAQQQPHIVTLQRFPATKGEYVGMAGSYMKCILNGDPVMVQFDKNSKVKITGTASADALAVGMYVQFKGTFNRFGKGTEPIKDVVIFSPDANNQPGAYEIGGGSNAFDEPTPTKKKGPPPTTTMYQIAGRITAVHKNIINVDCGNLKVKPEIAPDATVKLESSDPSWASSGDKITIAGVILGQGRALCSTATIEVSPIVGKKKSHVIPHVAATDKADKADVATDTATDKKAKADKPDKKGTDPKVTDPKVADPKAGDAKAADAKKPDDKADPDK
jgi:hypothetical protein